MAPTHRTRVTRALIAVAGCSFVVQPSYAYLDPGTGSIILQSILAVVAVAMGLLRLYWHRFKMFVSGLTGASRDQENDDGQEIGQESDAHNDS